MGDGPMNVWILLAAAALLSAERLTYVWILRAPDAFRLMCARPALARLGEPVAIVRKLFYAFKVLQASVFVGWCYVYGNGSLRPAAFNALALAVAGAAIVVGQILNWSVFYRLGWVGAFFGDRLGHSVRWCREFPFSLLAHPQYPGTVLTIWGVFIAMRFPRDDWYLIPALETCYYLAGAYAEGRAEAAGPPPRRQSGKRFAMISRITSEVPEAMVQSRTSRKKRSTENSCM
jgi:methylene-fatty-acyl-phospholipid synthase